MPYADSARKKAYDREYNASTPGRNKDRHHGIRRRATYQKARGLALRPFAGVDGEGGNLPIDGLLFGKSHEYLLLRAGAYKLETGRPLSWTECLSFLSDLPKDRTYIAYYFDYDVTMILRTAPWECVRKLFHKGKSPFMPTRFGDYEVRYLPHKEFAVRRVGQTAYTVVSDCGPFFQQSFVKSLEDWQIGTVEERAAIAEGKALRGDFEALDADTDRYNELEIRLLEELMTQYAETCEEVGYLPGKWQGPGWLATAILRKHEVPRSSDTPVCDNDLLMNLANEAYYGGRFEITRVGPVKGPVYEYDINSAYPYAMSDVLPCLRHGSWVRTNRGRVRGSLGFGQVSFSHPDGVNLCNLPIRTEHGGLVFPREGSGVYWSIELDAAISAGTVVESSGTWYEYRPGKACTCAPFAFIPELYTARKKLGGLRGKILKLGLNSLYGKLAQSIGVPAYANPIYASLITANTRRMLIDAYASNPDAVVALATDAVFSREPLDVQCGLELGQWERTEFPTGLFVVMPGMYYIGADRGVGETGAVHGTERSKTRGVNLSVFDLARDKFQEAYLDLVANRPRTVKLDGVQFITLRQAHAWNSPEKAGQWLSAPKEISFDWRKKRAEKVKLVEGGALKLFPQPGSPTLVSVPYGRSIGQHAAAREFGKGQPDFATWFQPG